MRSNAKKKLLTSEITGDKLEVDRRAKLFYLSSNESVIAHVPQGSITGHSKVPERGLKFVSLPI